MRVADQLFQPANIPVFPKHMDLETRYLEMIQHACDSVLRGSGAQVLLFGSRSRDDAKYASDVDLAIRAQQSEPIAQAKLKEQLEESAVPYRCDVVSLADADSVLRSEVEREGIVIWSD